MNTSGAHASHSAKVEMRLLLNGKSLRITQLGPDFLFLETPADYPPCQATILMSVDGNERCWDVHLPEGITSQSERVALALSS